MDNLKVILYSYNSYAVVLSCTADSMKQLNKMFQPKSSKKGHVCASPIFVPYNFIHHTSGLEKRHTHTL